MDNVLDMYNGICDLCMAHKISQDSAHLMQVAYRLARRGAVGGTPSTLAPGVIHGRLPVHFQVLLQLVSPFLLLGLFPGLHLGLQLCPAMLLN